MSGKGTLAPLNSSQDFVRALKAALDPPVTGGLSKLEIAEAAWSNANFYVPSKAELISDWLFTKLLKEKGKELPRNPIFNARHWQLIAKLISFQRSTTKKDDDSQSTKAWLLTLLHRIGFGPVIVSFLASFKDVQAEEQDTLASSVCKCLSVIWPMMVQRMSTELLQECFGAFLCAALASKPNIGISSIGHMISSSYRNSLLNTSNKKKLYLAFLQSYLKPWLQVVSDEYCTSNEMLKTSVLDAGIETLFNLDILRQNIDSKADHSLVEHLQVLSSTEKGLVYTHIQSILVYYIQAIRKHRGALFSQGSSQSQGASLDELHEYGTQFFISLLGLVQESERDTLAWTTRASLLEVVDKENLFNRKQPDMQRSLKHLLECILMSPNEGRKEDQPECTEPAVQCLSIVSHIDYDLVLPYVPRILPLLFQISAESQSSFTFLEILLSYHTKTRTMGPLIQSLITSIITPRACQGTPQQIYQISLSSPIMHNLYTGHLTKALQTFLTESQCISTMQIIFDALKDTWEHAYTCVRQREDVERSRKRQKTCSVVMDGKLDLDNLAITYALVARLASVVLSSLPLVSLPTTPQEDVRRLLDEFRTDFIYHTLSKSVKVLRSGSDGDIWSMEIITTASLRLLYALNISRNLCLPLKYNVKLAGKMLELVSDDDVLPELTVELFRALLYGLSRGNGVNPEDVISSLLDHLEKHFVASDVIWSGKGHQITKDELGLVESALALMHMVVERWLPEIDRSASPEQVERLLKIIMSIKVPVGKPKGGIRPEQLLLEIVHSAQFFEFSRIRDVFLDLLEKMTASLDPSVAKLPKTSTMLEKVAVYRHLLFFPMEYFSWPLLNDLIARAMSADVALNRSISSRKHGVAEGLTVLRVFLKRAYVYCGSIGQDSNKDTSDFLVSLLKDSIAVEDTIKVDFTKATIDLVEVYLSKLLKASKKTGSQSILQVLVTFTPDQFDGSHEIASSSFIALVNLLVKEFPRSSLLEDIIKALQNLYRGILTALLPRISSAILGQGNIAQHSSLVSWWYSLLCLQKWLECTATESAIPLIGQRLMTTLIQARMRAVEAVKRDAANDDLCVMTFAILLQELDAQPASQHGLQLDLIVAAYIALTGTLNPKSMIFHENFLGRNQMDQYLGRMCKRLAIEDYVHMLATVSESLAALEHIPSNQLLHLVHLAALLLHEHPSHSLPHIQKFATRIINIFTDHPIFVEGPVVLRLQALHAISQYCTSQPAALRSADISGICLLLSKFLAPAPAHMHDATTEPRIFHVIAAVLSALVRMRRDLLAAHALPHLGLLLREMLRCLRAARPGLGARQMKLVMDTQPRWMGADGPALGADEARVMARLLESLTAKTTVRSFGSASQQPLGQGQEGQGKAEALAKPFAKHATYVLQAHVMAANEPLCVLPRAVRHELKPGLYALCGMVSDHGRDALMVSALDGGGRATLKALWKEYEEQRYVGKG
ncbi:hypothetical protein BDN70DRAFT_931712 [Pholiota conissans]|uniref:Nucleolar 27S pre-rRNA processing Urb2/Npa2 C-terminal domain-containing protein n=1 Tax=Pholiota conissans TaxID=109636 RepID=A0A9P5Z2X9_9AGAR|nr:hypothetical protein BDN70DRAFT_931712 [Pholiota conissans]